MNDDLVSALYWSVYLFEMNILDENYKFLDKKEDADAWGILSDLDDIIDDWSWLDSSEAFQ